MTTDKREGWIRELKEGDQVAVDACGYPYMNARYKIGTVIKITPAGSIQLDCISKKFNSAGIIAGDKYTSSKRIYELTCERKDFIARDQAIHLIKNTDFSKVSTEKLVEIQKIIEN
jgi:hypothetical protein